MHDGRMKKSIFRNLTAAYALIAVLGLLYLAFGGWGNLMGRWRPLVLEIDLEQPLPEAEDSLLADLGLADGMSLRAAVETLEGAARNPRVKVLVARINSGAAGLARYQELRDAVTRFRAAGKRAIAYAETFGETAPSNGAYYLATAFDEIYLQPTGDFGLTGLRTEPQFLRGTFDKLGITPRGGHRYEYKNALNTYTERELTPPHREAVETMLGSQFDQIVRGIAERRGIPEPEVRALVDAGPHSARGALEARLVDGLLYRDEVYAKAREIAGEGADLLFLQKYRKRHGGGSTKASASLSSPAWARCSAARASSTSCSTTT